MPCYSYTTNSSITAGNIEIVTAASGNTYSYNNLAWVCEFPVENQILVYTRPTPTGTETLQVLGTHYNISGTDIVFTAGNTPTGEVVIRRTTATNKMLYVFNDGAKLTAEQLNGAFHQLLFALQEKDLAKSTTNYIYTISGTVGAWSGATAYVVGNIVSEGNSIYRCIAPTTNNQPPNATYWALVNPSQAGFVLTGNNAPISVNVSSLSQGKALVWNGSEFRADVFTGAFNDLTDVTLTSPATNQLLRYNGSQWVNITPSFDITLSSPVLADRAFYTSSITTSYTNNNTSISAPALLDRFKSNSNRWVLTDPPTVYHIISELTPGSDAPENWFSSINSTVNNLSQTLSNPVKAKLYWNLRTHKSNISNDTANNSDTLDNYKTLFYDSPDELYSVIGYDTLGLGPIKFHGVSNTSVIYKDNPYYYSVSSPSSFKSKIEGYGIKNFYLSVPECRSSNFLGLPIRSGNAYFTEITNIITDKCNALGNETDETIRDYYLLGLRELAFAANISNASVSNFTSGSGNVKNRMTLSRYLKGKMLRVNYNWGLSNTVNFARLEDPNDTGSLCLWKIPKQIIYYNKAAMALANTSTPGINVDNDIDSAIRKNTRFNGQSRFHEPITSYSNSTLTVDGNGTLFKADEYWSDWVNKWLTDSGNDKKDYQFMESDIEWMAAGVTNTTSNINLFDYYDNRPVRWNTTESGYLSGTTSNGRIFPWLYRSLEQRGTSVNSKSDYIGTLLHNIDSNTLFSTADSFIPDPTDEYVFRVVLNKDLTPVFKQTNITTLKSAIILEYGFSEKTNNRLAGTSLTTLDQIFPNPSMPATNYRALSRLKESDIRVYVKSENLETISGIERVVVTLGIRTPRLKSIGYAKVFRRYVQNTQNYPIHSYSANSNQSNDTEIDSGPWNFTFANGNISLTTFNTTNIFGITTDSTSPSGYPTNQFTQPASVYNEAYGTFSNTFSYRTPKEFVSGRNEAAVKFTRLGIPSTLWIRLSMLNTNASYDLINTSGFINTEPV